MTAEEARDYLYKRVDEYYEELKQRSLDYPDDFPIDVGEVLEDFYKGIC